MRLGPLIRLAERKRDECQERLRQGQDYLLRVEGEKCLAEQELERAEADFLKHSNGAVSSTALHSASSGFHHTRNRIQACLLLHERVLRVVFGLQQELLEARRELRQLERLQELQFERQRQAEAKCQQDELDEFGVLRYTRG